MQGVAACSDFWLDSPAGSKCISGFNASEITLIQMVCDENILLALLSFVNLLYG